MILALWTVGSAGIGAAVYLKVKPMYLASSLLKVEPTMIDLYGGSNRDGEPYMQTHVELIRSDNVLSDAVQDQTVRGLPRIRLARDAIKELKSVVMVMIRPGTHLIEVSMMSNSADEASTVVNAVVASFLDQNHDWSNSSTLTQIKKLNAYKSKLETDIKKTQEELRRRTAQSSVPMLVKRRDANEPEAKSAKEDDEAMAHSVEFYHKLQSQLLNVKLELINAETNLTEAERITQELKSSAPSADPKRTNALVERRLRADGELSGLLREFNIANSKADKNQGIARNSSDPAILKARESAMSAMKRYKNLQEAKRQQFLEELNSGPNGSSPEILLAEATQKVKYLTQQKMALEAELSKTKLENSKNQSDGMDIRFLETEWQQLEAMHETVHKKSEQLTFDSVDEERIRLISPARPEGQPISDKRMQYMAIAPVGILGAVLALVVLLEIRSGRVGDTEILASRMRYEVFPIAPLPNLRAGIGMDTSEKAEQRLARFVQSLDHLRVALCEGGSNGEGRCVMITSATGGEGKTTLSAHLAARCANAGTSTLLIDADLRRASLGRLLDVPPGLGLGDLLAGQAELDSGLITEQAAGFQFLSAGSPGIDPTRVLKSTRLAELIGQLRQMYDLVIIDTPPVLPVPDALILGRWADGAVMAARYDASRLPQVERANRQMIAAGIPVLGVVVNGVKGQDQAYGNYSYNYSYPGRPGATDETSDMS